MKSVYTRRSAICVGILSSLGLLSASALSSCSGRESSHAQHEGSERVAGPIHWNAEVCVSKGALSGEELGASVIVNGQAETSCVATARLQASYCVRRPLMDLGAISNRLWRSPAIMCSCFADGVAWQHSMPIRWRQGGTSPSSPSKMKTLQRSLRGATKSRPSLSVGSQPILPSLMEMPILGSPRMNLQRHLDLPV